MHDHRARAAVKPLGVIRACGVYVPTLRLPRTVIAEAMAWANPPARTAPHGARAICNWDEDAVTMAVEAGRTCVETGRAGVDAATVPQALLFCSTTAPFADRDAAGLVAAALDLPVSAETLNLGATLRAGTTGLVTAARRAADESVLLIAGEARLARAGSAEELTYGDAAVALGLGPAHPAALATVLGSASIGSDFVDHYRMSGSRFDYALEERWVRDESLMKLVPPVVAELLANAGIGVDSVNTLIVPAAAAAAHRIAQACGLAGARRNDRVLEECGNAGAALPLLMLAAMLEEAQPGDLVVMLGLGQGVDALLLRVESAAHPDCRPFQRALARRRDELSYVRYLAHRGLLDVDFGMRAERDQRTAHTVAYRKRGALTAFQGGRCTLCGTVQFPQSRVCVNPECRATDSQTPHRLAESSGRVKTFTEDWQAYTARPPYVYGNVEFAEGGNLLMEFTDVAAGDLKVNDAVRFVFRIKDDDRPRGYRRYFWKATKA